MTIWATRNKPTTSWAGREDVETSWSGRNRPILYITPLEDAYTKVADENDEIIYIYADSGIEIPATQWRTRPQII